MSEWSENRALWEAMEPALCSRARLALAESDVDGILACNPIPTGSHILDLACGPGAHAVAFARRGLRVTGLDTSSGLLERGRAAARREGVSVEWIEGDMRAFRRPGAFDLICSLYTSFGYFDDHQNRRVLEHALASLRHGGCLVVDVIGREVAARASEERRAYEVDGLLYVEQRNRSRDGRHLVSKWTVGRAAAQREFTVRQRLYSGDELRTLLLSVGFASVQIHGDLAGRTPYGERAERLVAAARAPAGPPTEPPGVPPASGNAGTSGPGSRSPGTGGAA